MLTEILKGLVRLYQVTLGTVLPNSCRFTPTCSEYALGAIGRYGPKRGVWLTVKRVLRCQPFSRGGYDPVLDDDRCQRGDKRTMMEKERV